MSVTDHVSSVQETVILQCASFLGRLQIDICHMATATVYKLYNSKVARGENPHVCVHHNVLKSMKSLQNRTY